MQDRVSQNIGLASKEALKYAHQFGNGNNLSVSEIYKDLLQEGIIGLDVADTRFDPSRGTQFSTFAIPWIKKYILLYIQRFYGQVNLSLDGFPTDNGNSQGDYDVNSDDEYSGPKPLIQTIASENTPLPSEFSTESEIQECVKSILASLSERERYIITKHFGMDGSQPMTFKEIGDVIGVTPQRVFAIEKEVMRRLRSSMCKEEVMDLLNN